MFITHVEYSHTSTFLIHENIKNKKRTCLHNGKLRCPHKGYNLSTVQPIDGIITCPLHNLKFKEDTKEIYWRLKGD